MFDNIPQQKMVPQISEQDKKESYPVQNSLLPFLLIAATTFIPHVPALAQVVKEPVIQDQPKPTFLPKGAITPPAAGTLNRGYNIVPEVIIGNNTRICLYLGTAIKNPNASTVIFKCSSEKGNTVGGQLVIPLVSDKVTSVLTFFQIESSSNPKNLNPINLIGVSGNLQINNKTEVGVTFEIDPLTGKITLRVTGGFKF